MLVDATGITELHNNQKLDMIKPQDLVYDDSILGKGNGGVVRKAVYRPLDLPLAVKIINVYDREKRH